MLETVWIVIKNYTIEISFPQPALFSFPLIFKYFFALCFYLTNTQIRSKPMWAKKQNGVQLC